MMDVLFTLEEARELLLIDKHNLDDVCVGQPELQYRVGEALALAISERDQLKAELELEYANVANGVRARVIRSGERTSEAKIDQEVKTNPTYQERLVQYNDKKLECDEWVAMRDAYYQRARMITEICNLFLANYYARADVRVSSKISEKEYDSIRRRIKKHRKSSYDFNEE